MAYSPHHPGLVRTQRIILSLLTTSIWLASHEATAQTQSVVTNSGSASDLSQNHSGKSLGTLPHLIQSGTQVSLNGRTLPVAWSQWQVSEESGRVRTSISDAGLMQLLGVQLLNTKDASKQPVQWFSEPKDTPLVLTSWHQGAYRYLDATKLTPLADWQLSANGNTLKITTPTTRVKAIRQGKQSWGERIVLDLDRPAPWQVTQPQLPPKPKSQPLAPQTRHPVHKPQKQEWLISISAATDLALVKRFNSSESRKRSKAKNISHTPVVKLVTSKNLTNLRLRLPPGLSPRIDTFANPSRIVIDIRPDAMVKRDILWAPGLRWRQEFVVFGAYRFPVVWLEVKRGSGLTLKPISSSVQSLVGIAPLINTAQRYSVAAAINGGFFNRNNKSPLGAIRRDGQWLSSPILNRGAIAWDDAGQVKIGRLRLQESIVTSSGQRLPILTLNSGYVQVGIARYSSVWGATYTPLTNNEVLVVVQNGSVTAQFPGGAAGKTAFPIPPDGYLLAIRAKKGTPFFLPVGTLLRQESTAVPSEFNGYPQILGAGPLLLHNRQFVLNAKVEGFSDAFIKQKAARSAICTTASGNLIIAAVHNRIKGFGPTLAESAGIMKRMGCIDALNLDGGSSTSLYLGGQLLNRSPRTAARVNNGLGLFFEGAQSREWGRWGDGEMGRWGDGKNSP